MTRKTSSSSVDLGSRPSSALRWRPRGSVGLSATAHEPDVDAAVGAAEHRLDGVLEGVDGQAEVAGEQVARASGKQTEGDVGADERRGDRADGAVATERGDDVGTGPTASRPCFSPVSSAVVSIHDGSSQPCRAAALATSCLRRVEVVDLDGVVDDGEAATARRSGAVSGMEGS